MGRLELVVHLALVIGRPRPHRASRFIVVNVHRSVFRLDVRCVGLRLLVAFVRHFVVDVLVLVHVADVPVLERVLQDNEVALGLHGILKGHAFPMFLAYDLALIEILGLCASCSPRAS